MTINTDVANMQKLNKQVDYKESEIWKFFFLLFLDLRSHQNVLLILMLSDRIVVSNKKTK